MEDTYLFQALNEIVDDLVADSQIRIISAREEIVRRIIASLGEHGLDVRSGKLLKPKAGRIM
jgi:uncharacterized protein (DUF342 family)